MAVLRLSTVARNALANAMKTAIDTGAGAGGTIKIYTGSQPATPQDTATGTLLATLTFARSLFRVGRHRGHHGQRIAQVNAGGTNTAGWARIADCGRQRHHGRGRGDERRHHQPEHHLHRLGRAGAHHQRHADGAAISGEAPQLQWSQAKTGTWNGKVGAITLITVDYYAGRGWFVAPKLPGLQTITVGSEQEGKSLAEKLWAKWCQDLKLKGL